jgi:hypothetical protein
VQSSGALQTVAVAPLGGQLGIARNMLKIGHEQGETLISPIRVEAFMNALFESRYNHPHSNGEAAKLREEKQLIRVPSPGMDRSLGRDFELIEAVANAGKALVDLWETSPVRLDSNEPNTDEIIGLLFPGNPLLCCGWSRHRFDTRARGNWYKLQDLQFVVPSPMTARQGLTREKKLSAHALTNTGPRRFLVIEFDFDVSNSVEETRLLERLAVDGRDVRDLCAALLLHLAEKAPLALAVHSGGKSLHGWFYCAGVPEQTLWRTFQYAVSLGADPANWTPSQFARMPDGQREKRRRQPVYFLNPEVLR